MQLAISNTPSVATAPSLSPETPVVFAIGTAPVAASEPPVPWRVHHFVDVASAHAALDEGIVPILLIAASTCPLDALAERAGCARLHLFANGSAGPLVVGPLADSARAEGGIAEVVMRAEALIARVREVRRASTPGEGRTLEQYRQLDAVFEHAPALLAVLSVPDLRYVLANPRVHALFRRPLVGITARAAHPEIEGQGVIEALERAAREGQSFRAGEVAVRLRRDDTPADAPPDERWLDLSFEPLHDADGRTEAVLMLGVEVTQSVRARRRIEALAADLARTEARFRRVFDSNLIGFVLSRPDGTILRANDYFLAMVGLAPGAHEAGTLRWDALLAPESLPRAQETAQELARTGVLPPYEIACVRGDGARIPVLLGSALLPGREAEVVTFVLDIEGRKRAERGVLLLARAGETLSSTLDERATLAALMRLVTPSLADGCGVHLLEDSGTLRLAAAVGRDATETRAIHDADRAAPLRADAQRGPSAVLQTLRTEVIEDLGETLARTGAADAAHGRALAAMGVTSSLVTPLVLGGRAVGTLSLWTFDRRRRLGPADVPVVEELGRRVASAIDNARLFELAQRERTRAEDANRAKDEFMATMSHELRTPLTAILGWTRMLRTGAVPDEARRARALETVERNARAQLALIEDVLDVSRIITGKLRLNIGPVDLATVVEAAMDTVRPAADARGVTLHTLLDPDAGTVAGDADRLQQVVWNLLSNAIKFTPRNGDVDVRLRRRETHLELCIRDTGEGISPAFLPHVFERFRQADGGASRAHGGLGLGLAIVKHLVELHGGTVCVDSDGAGMGSTFTVRLPGSAVRLPTFSPLVRSPAAVREGSIPPPCVLDGISVLVVDDESDARELLRALFEHAHAVVHLADSTPSALEALDRHAVDVLVSDIGMPGEDGYTLMRKVRARPPAVQGALPSVALTAYTRAEDRARAQLAGFSLHVAKPVDPQELIAAVAGLASGRDTV